VLAEGAAEAFSTFMLETAALVGASGAGFFLDDSFMFILWPKVLITVRYLPFKYRLN